MYQGGTIHKVCRGTFYPGYERNKVGSKPDDIAVLTVIKLHLIYLTKIPSLKDTK